jgi:hypothetical protein
MKHRAIQTLPTCAHICTTSTCYLLRLVRANMLQVSRLSQHRGILSEILVLPMRMCARMQYLVAQAIPTIRQDAGLMGTRIRHTIKRCPAKPEMRTARPTVSCSGRT